MQKLQRLSLNLLALIFLGAAILLIVRNLGNEVSAQGLTDARFHVSLGVLLLVNGVLVALAIGSRLWVQLLILAERHKKASRELERKDVSHEEAESRVKVLENKVQTLEKALSEALKKHSS
jgi:hypothetical protein